MKNLLLLICLLINLSLIAQNKEGTIFYTETVKFEIELPPGQEHLKDMIPSSQSISKALYFTADQSMYKDVGESDEVLEEKHQQHGEQQVMVKVLSASSDNRLLKDFTTKKVIDQRDFMGKKFLINGELEAMTWKITGEQKKILDFVCQKAVMTEGEKTTIAWFTLQIPVSNGPDKYGQLPGMILGLELEEGKRTYMATKVEFGTVAPELLEKPKKGKKVTTEAFQKIKEEKIKEMGGGGNGTTTVRMEIRN